MDTKKTLESVQAAMIKQFGKGAVTTLSSSDALSKVDDWVSTGSLVIDKVIVGGRPVPCSLVPYGRMIEIAGKNGTGKTTLCAQIARRVQEQGGIVVVMDTEDRVDEPYWRALGVNTDEIITIHARTLEEAFEKQCFVIKEIHEQAPGQKLYLLWDSLGSLQSSSTMTPNKKMSFMEAAAKNMGRDAKTITAGVKMVHKLVAETNTLCIYTNHVYHKVGVTYGPTEETYGGEKWKYFCTLRLMLRAGSVIKKEDEFGNIVVLGKQVHVETLKNSMAPSLMRKTAYLLGGQGFCDDYTIRDVAKKMGWIETKGSWSTWHRSDGAEVKFQGEAGFLEKVVMDDLYDELYEKAYEVF